MKHFSRPAAALGVLALSSPPVLLAPSPVIADTVPGGGTNAAIEYAERLTATDDHQSKAQIERDERESAGVVGTTERRGPVTDRPSSSGGSAAAAWQLALSAALGATATGGVVLAARQVSNHKQPVAS